VNPQVKEFGRLSLQSELNTGCFFVTTDVRKADIGIASQPDF